MVITRSAEASPRTGDFQSPGQLTSALDDFMLSRQVGGCTKWTCVTYRGRLERFAAFLAPHGPHGGDDTLSLESIRRADVEDYLLLLQRRGRKPHYIESYYRTLRAFFNWCVAEEYIRRSPLRNMKPPILPKRAKPFLAPEQRDRLLACCPPNTFLGDRNRAVIWLLWGSGMRLAELGNLKLDDLDWTQGRIKVFGKGQKERFAPFTKMARKAVVDYLVHRRDSLPWLWLTEERGPAKAYCLVSAMRRLIERSGQQGEIKDVMHIFRRSWARRMIQKPVSLKYVQLAGGWANLTVLMQYVEAIESEEAVSAILDADDGI